MLSYFGLLNGISAFQMEFFGIIFGFWMAPEKFFFLIFLGFLKEFFWASELSPFGLELLWELFQPFEWNYVAPPYGNISDFRKELSFIFELNPAELPTGIL